jgi:type IV pilus assembly protein PilP
VSRAGWLLLAFCAACGDDTEPPPKAPVVAKPAAAPAPARPTAVTPLKPPPAPTKESLLTEVRRRQLSNEDFVESDANRDPFRSYLATFAVQPPIVGKQHKIVLQKFALDELKLVGIVQGNGVTPKAMFVDPSGMGVMIVRGDHVSKADAAVVRIAPDRVFFQIEEDAGGGKTKTVERVIELHAGELVSQ